MDSYQHDGFVFEVSDWGPGDGRLLIALHGFPEDRQCWQAVAGAASLSGRRVLAPDQRGYSPLARPADRAAYTRENLCSDVLGLADSAGAERFDLIGHDWGGIVAWELAARNPERVRSLTVLSAPHPSAFRQALFRGGQVWRSWYMAVLQIPWLPEAGAELAGAGRIAASLRRDGVDPSSAERYAARLSKPATATGPINWYRAMPLELSHPTPQVRVPTLYVWGNRDRYLSRAAAEATAGFVGGPYRFEVLGGAGHWLPETESDRVVPLLLAHLDSAA
jgi:pimeloyl-ACP methyl ester carboxylesterase